MLEAAVRYTPVKTGVRTRLVVLKDGKQASSKREEAEVVAQQF